MIRFHSRRADLPWRGVAAHRGGCGRHPENTVAALSAAARVGVQQIEFDVRRCATGELVIMHDASVDRTTDGKGLIEELSLAALKELDAGAHLSPEFAGERIPTLDEALEVLPRNLWINVQLKQRDIAVATTERLVHHARLDQALLACRNADGLVARKLAGGLQLCSLSRKENRAQYVAYSRWKRAQFIQYHYKRGIPTSIEVTAAKLVGLTVNYFCQPKSEHEDGMLEHLFKIGIDFLLVDDLDAALAVTDALGIMRTNGSS